VGSSTRESPRGSCGKLRLVSILQRKVAVSHCSSSPQRRPKWNSNNRGAFCPLIDEHTSGLCRDAQAGEYGNPCPFTSRGKSSLP
jgi:hypothetical protein